MKVIVDKNISGETPELKGATSDKSVQVSIQKVELVAAEDLPESFENREDDRYQITILLGDDEKRWMPNKTALKTIVAAYGDESDNWIGKTAGLFLADQNVAGKMKKVVYCII